MSKPSGAIVTVAAIANTVLIDIARRIFTILLDDMNALPLDTVNNIKQSTSANTAAQLTKKRLKLKSFFFVTSIFIYPPLSHDLPDAASFLSPPTA